MVANGQLIRDSLAVSVAEHDLCGMSVQRLQDVHLL